MIDSKRLSRPALLLSLLPLVGACSGSNAGDGQDASMNGAVDMASSTAMDMADPLAPPPFCASGGTLTTKYDSQFVGYWAIQSKVTQTQDLSGSGLGKVSAVVTTLSLAEFKLDAANNNRLVMVQNDCKITLAGGNSFVTTTVPDKVPQSTPSSTQPIKVCENGSAVSWQRDQATVIVSCNLTDPLKDALPTTDTDPRVTDQDADGKLGVTIKISGFVNGDVYTVQRQRFTYTSTALPAAGKASGATVDRSEQNTIGATNPTLKTKVPIAPDDANSSFRLTKLSGQMTCAQVIAAAGTLFP